MNTLIPSPDTIPAAWGILQFLLLLTFPVHLLFMNSVLGGSALALYSHWRGGAPGERLAHELAKVLPLLIALTINFGVAPLLFIQVLYGQFIYVSSILMGVFWLAVIPVLLIAYYTAYLYDFRFASMGRRGVWLIGLCLLLVLGIAFIYTNNMTLMLRPQEWSAYFKNSGGTLLNLQDPTFWPRYLHFILGGIAVGALLTAFWSRRWRREDPELSYYTQKLGLRVFVGLTLIQVVTGGLFLVQLPHHVMLEFMGGNVAATIVLLVSIALAVAVLVTAIQRRLGLTVGLTVLLLVVMTWVRSWVRSFHLDTYFTLDQLTLTPEYSPLVLFAVTLVIGLALIGWMLRAARNSSY